MRTKSEQFVFEKRERWKRLRDLVAKISRYSCRKLTSGEAGEFPGLYRLVCTDLAEARMLKLSPDVITYLNNIIGQAHKYLYNFPVTRAGAVRRFFLEELPALFCEYWRFIVLSAVLFLLPLTASFIFINANPGYAAGIVGRELLAGMEASYSKELSDASGWGRSTYALSYYIQHNISIAFVSFAVGILAGFGTVYFLVYNGIVLGTIGGYIQALGYGANFWRFVCAHSVFELTGLILAGAAGLFLGYSIVKAAPYKRRDWLNLQRGNILKLLFSSVLLIACAAVIEGVVSPSAAPLSVRVWIALLSAGSLVFYFGLFKRLRRRRTGAQA